MRAPLLLAALVLGAVPPAVGAEWTRDHPRPKPSAEAATVPLNLNLGLRVQPPASDRHLLTGPKSAYEQDNNTSVSVGPFRARLEGEGRDAHVGSYRLDDVDILGGGVSGTVDGRGARIFLRWPPDEDE